MNDGQNTSLPQDDALRRCLARIEEKLGWGDVDEWTSHDFEELSLRIQEETSGVVSATTLKRVWGRVAYDSTPSRHTLNTLAEFAGCGSWREWMEGENEESSSFAPRSDVPPPSPARRLRSLPSWKRFAGICTVVLVAGIGLWAGLDLWPERSAADARPEVRFTSRIVAEGLPNTVIFEYDVSGVDADSFFIQQSWDASRRVRISPDQRTLTSTYYEPGFYNASLIANDEVLRSHPVHVTTVGWLALIEGDPSPTYLTPMDVHGYLLASEEQLDERDRPPTEELRIVSFYNVRPFEPLHTDDFAFETVVRHPGKGSVDPCRRAEIAVLGEHGALAFLLGIPGCVGDLEAMFSDVYLDGAKNDLSALGIDLSDWQRLEMHVEDRSVRLQVGDNDPLAARFTKDIGQVVGLQYRFAGSGAIDHVTLRDADGGVVYDESF